MVGCQWSVRHFLNQYDHCTKAIMQRIHCPTYLHLNFLARRHTDPQPQRHEVRNVPRSWKEAPPCVLRVVMSPRKRPQTYLLRCTYTIVSFVDVSTCRGIVSFWQHALILEDHTKSRNRRPKAAQPTMKKQELTTRNIINDFPQRTA